MIGRTVGHYEVVEKLGAGGMGEVYRARQNQFSATPDGERLYLVRYPPEETTGRRIVYVPNWTAELDGRGRAGG